MDDIISVLDLWLPIVLSTVAVFFASFIVWMVLPHHAADVKKLPDEQRFLDQLKAMEIPPGTYMWPNCGDKAEMKSEEFKRRFNEGPWGSMTVVGGEPNFGLNLGLTMLFYLVVSVLVGYITSEARTPYDGFWEVFQVATTAAILAYCAGGIPNAIFFSKPKRFIITDFTDNLAYAVLTGAIFGWLWPSMEAAATPVLPGT